MKKTICFFFLCLLPLLSLVTGCAARRGGAPEKKEVPFTVVSPDDIPGELAVIIEENKQGELKLTFEDGKDRYLVRGYGEQKSGGYSIAVNEVYLAADGLHADTSLIGPSKDQEIREEASYPCLVLKLAAGDEEIFLIRVL